MINKVILVGRLTADPELRKTKNGTSVTQLTVACNRPFVKDKDAQQADFISCVAWKGTAENICKYFRKGSAIGIDGCIQTRKYTDKNGNNRVAVEVLISSISFIEKKKQTDTPPLPEEPPYNDFQDIVTSDDDLPF